MHGDNVRVAALLDVVGTKRLSSGFLMPKSPDPTVRVVVANVKGSVAVLDRVGVPAQIVEMLQNVISIDKYLNVFTSVSLF
jgi:hypothetical protein